VPPQEQWHALPTSSDTAPELRTKIEALQSIYDAGARVLTMQADAADATAMRRVMAELHQEYGAVHGVIHAAGIAGGRIIRANTPEDAQAVLAPKVNATEWILQCLAQPELDFVLLCSSISAVVPSVGQSDYGAANGWMDGFAAIHDDPTGTRVISVNWDTWRDVGMAVNTKVPSGLEEVRKQLQRHAIRPHEAMVVFDRVLAFPMSQMLVSTRDFERVRQAAMSSVPGARMPVQPAEPRPIPRSDSRQSPEGSEDEVEAAIMEVWEELLGVPVSPQDNFFELGGHSLVGTLVISRIRERFGVNLSLRTVFEAVTPAELAERIRLMRWALNPVQDGAIAIGREEMEF
jgi:NAD(P)-dependent dehydrogenase (short-subunit alcohol dehydrogenase family)